MTLHEYYQKQGRKSIMYSSADVIKDTNASTDVPEVP